MSKTKAELVEGAKPIFEYNKGADEIWATVDGQYFLKENTANSHARQNRDEADKPLGVVKISRVTEQAAEAKQAAETKKAAKAKKAAEAAEVDN